MGITRSNKLIAIDKGSLHIDIDTSIRTLDELLEKKTTKKVKIPANDTNASVIAPKLKAQASEYTKGVTNVNHGLGALAVAEDAIEQLKQVLIKKSEVASVAADPEASKEVRDAAKTEFDALGKEFDRIISEAEFNGMQVLTGDLNGITIQTGSDSITINLEDTTTEIPKLKGEDEIKYTTTDISSTNMARSDGGYAAQVALADFNGDGNLDMAVSDYGTSSQAGAGGYSNSIYVSWGDGKGGFSSSTSFRVGNASRPYSLKVADVNGDGNQDIIAGTMQDDKVYVLKGTGGSGSGAFSSPTKISTYAKTLLSVGVGDVNGDGNEDIIAVGRYNVSSTYKAYVLAGNGNGNFTAVGDKTNGAEVGGEGSFVVETSDFNGDGYEDAVIANRNTSSFSIMMSNGTKLTDGVVYGEDGAVNDVTIGDIDNDGNDDLVLAVGSKVAVYKGSGDGNFSKAFEYDSGATVTSVSLGDIDGDGSLDIASTAGASKEVFISMSKGDGTFYSAYSVATAGNSVDSAMGDLNGDGKADLVTADSYAKTATAYVATKSSLNIDNSDNAKYTAERLLTLAEKLDATKGTIKGYQDRLDIAMSTLDSSRTYYDEAYERVANADIAEVLTETLKETILNQTNSALLAHAGLKSKNVVSLLCDSIMGNEIDEISYLKLAFGL